MSDLRRNIYASRIAEVFVDDVFATGRLEVDVGDTCGRECLSLVSKESESARITISVLWRKLFQLQKIYSDY